MADDLGARLTVRVATADDLAILLPLMVAFREHLGQHAPDDGRLRLALERLLGEASTDFILARDGGTALGYAQCRYRFSAWTDGLDVEIEDLFVAAGGRRRGVGRQLIEHALAAARLRGCRLACLATNERNQPALALYGALGFSAARARWQGARQLWLERPLDE